jgi:hypothetical protein
MKPHIQTEATRKKISLTCKKRGVGKWMIGRKHPPEQLLKMSESNKGKHSIKRPDEEGKKHRYWKGENASYRSIHAWVVRKRGKSLVCERCGSLGGKHHCHWANVDHKYKRNLFDYLSLCPKCHGRYDKERKLRQSI